MAKRAVGSGQVPDWKKRIDERRIVEDMGRMRRILIIGHRPGDR